MTVPQHDHMPPPEALKMVGDAYKKAPPLDPSNNTKGIRVHFDVGPALAATYASQIQALAQQAGEIVPSDAYIVQAQARGGETILETACNPDAANCFFPDYRGTVGWRLGFELYRDAPVADSGEELTIDGMPEWQEQAANCGTAANPASCTQQRRRFDPERRPLFHYLLYAHARGKPKSSLPCLVNGVPAAYPSGTSCAPNPDNPDLHVPSSTSGVADLPGGSGLITLGLWDQVSGTGTVYAQAATTFHELGHQLNLWHGGAPAVPGKRAIGPQPGTNRTLIEPNCKPNYQSTMSYLFQVHGLVDTAYQLRLDYSPGRAQQPGRDRRPRRRSAHARRNLPATAVRAREQRACAAVGSHPGHQAL